MKKKFILLMMLLAIIGGVNLDSLRAQETITIGSGTEVQAFIPLQANYDNTISEQIFLAEDFQGKTGSITSYAFKSSKDLVSYGTPITVTRNFKIYMINTDKASFVSSTDWVNMTDVDLVFNGSVIVQPKDTWTTITFDTPFEYEEGKNVLLCIVAEGSWNNLSGKYYKHTTTNVRSLVYYVDATSIDATNITVASKFDNLNYVAQAQFSFSSSGEEPEQPTAPATPTNLAATATGETTIALTWNAVENATSYNIYSGTTTVATSLTETTYTIENLTAGTEYCYNVTAVNDNGESAATADVCATTNAAETPEEDIHEITIGSGAETTNAAPFRTTSHYSWVEMLYKGSDIGQACSITSLSFRCTNHAETGGTADLTANEIKIYLAEVTKSAMMVGQFTPEANLTLVYEGTNVDLGDEEWETFTLNAPFSYSGTNNLAVVVSKSASSNAQSMVWASDIADSSILFDFHDSNPAGAQFPSSDCFLGGNGHIYNKLPVIKLGTGTTPDQPEDPETGNEIVVGNGTESSSVAPFRNSSRYSWVETYYAKEELGQAMTITSLAYNCATYELGSGYTLNADQIEIYIGETENSNHSSSSVWIPQNELTLVYSGSNILLGEEEWETFVLDIPYEYSGTKNLAIAVSKSSASYNSAMKWKYTSVSKSNNYRGNDSNEAFADYPVGNGTTNGNRPNIKIGYSNAVVPEIPAAPTNLVATATSGSTIDLTWDAVEGATEYNVYNGTIAVATGLTSTSYNATGLTEGTEYCYNVTAVNIAGESAASAEACATPVAGEESQYALFDNFDDGNLDGWRLIDSDGDGNNWKLSTGAGGIGGVGGSNCIYSESHINGSAINPDNYIVTTTTYTITEGSVLEWDVMPSNNQYYQEHYGIVYSTDGEFFYTIWEETLPSVYEYLHRTLELDYIAGQTVYIGFRHYMCTDNDAICIDNVVMTIASGQGSTAEGDTWQNAIAVTEYPFTHTPDFANLNNDYTLPGEEQDGADVVYKLTFAEETTFSASVTGANGKIALYAEDFNGEDNPGANNYYGAEEEEEEEEEDPDPTPDPEGATTFFYDFNDATMTGWSTLDADGDGENWEVGHTYGQLDGTANIYSMSYTYTPLTPDNYIYTTDKYHITSTSTLEFDIRLGNIWYQAEYYGVAISEDGINFTTIFEESAEGMNATTHKTIDLSAYAGKNVHIALRHFNCSAQDAITVDNIKLSDGSSQPDPDPTPDPEGAKAFFYDFNNESLADFTTTDNDNDTYGFYTYQYGIDGYSLASDSYILGVGILHPDNYIYTTQKYTITAQSQITYKVSCAYTEYYAAVISTDGVNFTNVLEESIQSTQAQERIIDLSTYAGQEVHIGFRHYNCSDGLRLLIDNWTLSDGTAKRNRTNSIDNMTVPAGTYYLVASATETFSVNINTASGENPDLIPVAQVTATENGANVDLAWTMNRDLVVTDAKSGKSIKLDETRDANGYTFHSYKVYRANGDNTPIVLANNLTDMTFQDTTWSEAETGVYKWGVAAMYTANEATRENTTILNEGFETSYYVLPEGWTHYSDPATANSVGNFNVMNSIYQNYQACTGEYSAFTLGGYANNDDLFYLVSPAIDFSSSLNPTLSFNYICPAWNGAYNTLSVKYSESATGPWTDLWTGAETSEYNWANATIDLSDCSGKTIYIAFCSVENKAWGTGVDDVVVTATPSDGPIPVASEIVWSNTIDKNMTTTVDVRVVANDGGSVAGTTVTLENVNEPTYVYTTTLDATGQYTWNDVRKGTYEVTISLEGYNSCATAEVMEITDATTIECTLEAKPEIIEGLYVSPTAWAMWDEEGSTYDVIFEGTTVADDITATFYQLDVTSLTEGQQYTTSVVVDNSTTEAMEYTWTYIACDNFAGVVNLEAEVTDDGNAILTWTLPVYENQDPVYEFESNFDNGSLNGWTTIDADGDARNWQNTSEFANQGFGIDNTYCAASMSYDNEAGALYPDNYLVTSLKYTITEGAKLTYRIAAQNNTYCEEYYAVAVSTTNNNSAAAFTNIYEEELTAGDVEQGSTFGQWFEREIDLSEYVGETIYIAFRHFNCSDQWWLKLDNVELSNLSRRDDEGEWLFYDNGINESAFGFMDYNTMEPQSFYWAIMFPADVISQYAETQITKVSMYIYEAHEGAFSIHTGGDYAPGTMVHVQEYNATATGTYEEFELTTPITISGTENVWIQFSNTTGYFVAAHSADCGEANGRWMSNDGITWYDSEWYGVDFGYGTWQIRAFVEGNANPIPDEPEQAQAEVLGAMIYRNGELLTAEPLNAETYTDNGLATGEYEYEVRVVYGGESTSTYYAMSCAEEITVSFNTPIEVIEPYDLEGAYTYNEDGTFGATLNWVYPYTPWDHFNIYRSTSNGNYELIGETGGLTYFDEVEEGTYYYQVTAVNIIDGEEYESVPALAKGSTTEDYVIVDVTAINENGVNGLKVYPNPTQDNVNIFAENMTRITISNTLGQIVYDQEVDSDNEIINMSQYEAGVYSVRITTENGVTVQRITVVK